MQLILFLLVLFAFAIPAHAEKESWVTIDRLNRRTCPEANCGIVGHLFFREKAVVYEEKDESWN